MCTFTPGTWEVQHPTIRRCSAPQHQEHQSIDSCGSPEWREVRCWTSLQNPNWTADTPPGPGVRSPTPTRTRRKMFYNLYNRTGRGSLNLTAWTGVTIHYVLKGRKGINNLLLYIFICVCKQYFSSYVHLYINYLHILMAWSVMGRHKITVIVFMFFSERFDDATFCVF